MSQNAQMPAVTLEDVRHRATLTVPEAGALLGIGRSGAYGAAARGDLPTIRVGRSVRVPVAPLLRMLGVGDERPEPAATA